MSKDLQRRASENIPAYLEQLQKNYWSIKSSAHSGITGLACFFGSGSTKSELFLLIVSMQEELESAFVHLVEFAERHCLTCQTRQFLPERVVEALDAACLAIAFAGGDMPCCSSGSTILQAFQKSV